MEIRKHFEKLKNLLAIEEKEEIRQFNEEFLEKTPEERELLGKSLLHLRLIEAHYSPGDHRLLTFAYANGRSLPQNAPDVGNVLCLTKDSSDPLDGPSGTVYACTQQTITLAFSQKLPFWASDDEGIYHLNVTSKKATYRQMYETLDLVKEAQYSRLSFLRDISLGIRKPESYDPIKPNEIHFYNPSLNDFQKAAVNMAIGMKDLAIVHGPPGTGKTTVLIEVIRQTIQQEKFVFATAPSNTACDHLTECLSNAGVAVIRLGHPARIMEHLRKHTLDYQLASHPLTRIIDEHELEIERMNRKRDRYKERRELSWDDKKEMKEDIHARKLEIAELESKILSDVIRSAQVVIGTHASASDPILKNREMDLLVMDEASQATEPSAWLPILRAKKVLLAGDHCQLPPTVISQEAESGGLGKTLFERCHKMLGPEWKMLLRIQYRMNQKIMGFSSKYFYQDLLIADPSVSHHLLCDLPSIKKSKDTQEAFLLIDTAGRGFEEKIEKGTESYYNPEEAELVLRKLSKLLQLGVKESDIAVIAPYSAQVRWIKSLLKNSSRIEVDTVDGFQGREKEAVLLSLVRSNFNGEIGFLSDKRRMNVAMTRAKRSLIVIGDSATLSRSSFYQDWIAYAEAVHGYRSVWEEEI